MNNTKFGTWFSVPYDHQLLNRVQKNRFEVLARNDDTLVHLYGIPVALYQYFRPDAIGFRSEFPWLQFPEWKPSVPGDLLYDHLDRTSSLPAAMPLLTVLAVVGIIVVASARKRPAATPPAEPGGGDPPATLAALRLPLVAAACATIPTLAFIFLTQRYTGDFVPFLVLAAVAGLFAFVGWASRRRGLGAAARGGRRRPARRVGRVERAGQLRDGTRLAARQAPSLVGELRRRRSLTQGSPQALHPRAMRTGALYSLGSIGRRPPTGPGRTWAQAHVFCCSYGDQDLVMLDHSTIVEAVAPVLAARGLALYDVEVTGAGRAPVVRVLVASSEPSTGVDLDAIGTAAESISLALDAPEVARGLPAPYTLEVSSPGLERPLRRPDHFRGAVGETVSVKPRGAARVRGTLLSADDSGAELALDDGPARRFAYDDIEKARTVFEWGAASSRKVARR